MQEMTHFQAEKYDFENIKSSFLTNLYLSIYLLQREEKSSLKKILYFTILVKLFIISWIMKLKKHVLYFWHSVRHLTGRCRENIHGDLQLHTPV